MTTLTQPYHSRQMNHITEFSKNIHSGNVSPQTDQVFFCDLNVLKLFEKKQTKKLI